MTAFRQVGRYTIYDEIAAGGMASVHIGRLQGPAGFNRTVAIKCLFPQFARDPDFVTMFMDEARLAARVQHPNVVSVVDIVGGGGDLFLVMDYVDGESLARLLATAMATERPMPREIVGALISQMLHGLHAAHEARNELGEPLHIVHRDVSPQNVLVGRDGHARVLDFGVAKAVGRAHATREGLVKGKMAYIAPEQLLGKPVDRRADVHAAGVVLWELLTNQRRYDEADEASTIWKVVHEQAPAPSAIAPNVPPALDALVLAALDKDPENRPATAREMAVAVEEQLGTASAVKVAAYLQASVGDILVQRARRVLEIEQTLPLPPVSQAVRAPPSAAAGGTDVYFPNLELDAPPPRAMELDAPFEPPADRGLDLDMPMAPPRGLVPQRVAVVSPMAQAVPTQPVLGEMAALPMDQRLSFELAGQSHAPTPMTEMHRARHATPHANTVTSSRASMLPIVVGAVALAGAVLGGGAYFMFRGDDPAPAPAATRDLSQHERTLCEATRGRLQQGDLSTGLELDGWLAEIWIAGKPGVDPSGTLGSVIEAGDLSPRVRGTLGDASGKTEIVTVPAPPHSRAPSEGAALRLSNEYARRLLSGKETQAFVELADRVFERTEARAGMLYARCAHLTFHDAIVWVRGRTPRDAAAALLYATSYDESPTLPTAWLSERYDSILLPLAEATRALSEPQVVALTQSVGGTAIVRDGTLRMTFDVDRPQVIRAAAVQAGKLARVLPP